MAWRKRHERFPAPLREFREDDWPPVPGECLDVYTCHANGYGTDCTPRPGEQCGNACYALLAADRPEILAAAKRSDAYTRYHKARLNWLGEGSDGYIAEVIAGWQQHEAIRYAPFRNPQ